MGNEIVLAINTIFFFERSSRKSLLMDDESDTVSTDRPKRLD